MEQGPQGFNGVSLADRTVRQLGVELANTQITLATQNARFEELLEVVNHHINFELWEEVSGPPMIMGNDAESEGPQGALPPAPDQKYLVPVYQVDAVARLISMITRQ